MGECAVGSCGVGYVRTACVGLADTAVSGSVCSYRGTYTRVVSHLPQGDWRIGAPFYFCAVLQGAALVLAISHFRRERQAPESVTNIMP